MDDDQRNTESNIDKKSSQQPGIDKGNRNNESSASSSGAAKAGASATTTSSSLMDNQEEHVPLHQQKSSTDGVNPPWQEINETDGKGKDEIQAREDPRSQPSEEIDRFPEKVRKQTRSATITRLSHLLSIVFRIFTLHHHDPVSTDN